MRYSWMLYLVVAPLGLACGQKAAPESAVSEEEATEAAEDAQAQAATEPEPEAEAAGEAEAEGEAEAAGAAEGDAESEGGTEAEEPPPPVVNADFDATVKRNDGTSLSGHVKRVERSEDWYGETIWLVEDEDILLTLEGEGTEVQKPWSSVARIHVEPGEVPEDVDCSYDSDYRPWMYNCTLRTTATATLEDGSQWTVGNRHKWRFTFEDDSTVEFWLNKHPARQQDVDPVDLGDSQGENYGLYETLQDRLREERKTLVVDIRIQSS